ncbi:hypothetical protein [Rhodopirellula baltica]|nr:hypothetical protein [Rhodopirellula baltica]
MDRFSCQRSLTCAGPLSTFRGQFHIELYDLDSDPGETVNLAADERGLREEFTALFEANKD